MKDKISFNKADMTYITDIDIMVIKYALENYRKRLVDATPDNIMYMQIKSINRLLPLFNEPGILAVPYFPIDENE